jgi:hypothetical protein
VIDDLASGAYELPDLGIDDLRSGRRLTTDERHFRAIVPLTRRFDSFRILPADL